MKEKQIRKVTLSSEGLKGLIIEGTLETVKENRIAINGFKDTVKHPIHLDLEEKIRDLRLHALTIAGLITDNTPKSEKSSLISSCNVLSFEVGEDYFVLKVESRVFDTKYIKFSTPRVDSSDGYEYFEIVNQLLRDILIEVHAYMKGLKKITDEEITVRYIQQGKSNIDLDAFKEMSNEDKRDYMTAVLEKLGCIVITNEDMDVSTIDITEELLELDIAEPIKLKA
jgi:hypothetical protein